MKKSRTALICLILIMSLTLPLSITGCQSSPLAEAEPPLDTVRTEAVAFAPYREVPVNLNPSIKPYRIEPDLSNVTNKDYFEFSPEAQRLLVENGFVVIPSQWREFFSLYEINRYGASIPNFITTDAMMHNYHLYFNHLLRTLEKSTLRAELVNLTESMLTKSEGHYNELKRTDWENAAKRNVAFFAVAASLLDPDTKIPSYVRSEVEKELEYIAAHEETLIPSPVMNMGNSNNNPSMLLNEDYTQYIPRGHYANSDDLKTYFNTMMWYGRMTFRASSDDETKSAALIGLLLNSQQDYDSWNSIYEPTNFFVGKSDDLGIIQYHQLLIDTYKGIPSLNQLTSSGDSWEAFRAALEKMDPPALNSMPIYDASIQPDREDDVKGFRFMGQRFTPDASIFQRLIYREVQENKAGERRMLPNGLDIPAAMGSETAFSILDNMGETGYAKFSENMEYLRRDIESLDSGIWTQNLYWTWLYTLEPLTEPKGVGYPSFMQNQAWNGKQLETFLGSWAELKHDTILYAKQVYAEMGGGMEKDDVRGYVEPNPVVYGRLAALTRMTLEGLEVRNLLSEGARDSLEHMEELALKLKVIAEKELALEPLTDEEYQLIESFGGQLEHFWLEAMRDIGVDHPSAIYENPAALIADVATDPSGQVLEVGTGFISSIYAVVPIDGKLRITKGAVYSYYEFPWPASDRLTDDKWKSMLENETAPNPPLWTEAYTAQDEVVEW